MYGNHQSELSYPEYVLIIVLHGHGAPVYHSVSVPFRGEKFYILLAA